MGISTVLFDADGVLQSAEPLFAHFEERYGWSRQRLTDFFRHVFLERGDYQGAETGEIDPVPVFATALADWGWTEPTEVFLQKWLELGTAPDPVALALVAKLRGAGVQCALGTNQESPRARYMHEDLGYRDLFDQCFYSCALGVAKPDPVFFQRVLAELAQPPDRVLFVDDHAPNVAAARECGMHAEVLHPGAALRDTLALYALPV